MSDSSDLRRGISAALGIAEGPAFVWERQRVSFVKRQVDPAHREDEVERFGRALEAGFEQILALSERIKAQHRDPGLILEAQALMLRDAQIVEKPVRLIRDEGLNAEWAVAKVIGDLTAVFADADDPYLGERAGDIAHIGELILRQLTGQAGLRDQPPPAGAVVVAHEISPGQMVRLHRARVAALVMDVGGRTSHVALMARAFGIPAVLGLRDLSAELTSGDYLIVDGNRGEVLLCPSNQQLAEYREQAEKLRSRALVLRRDRDQPAVTTDGVRLRLLANIELAEELPIALDHGAEGVGLYRTEFLYLDADTLPSEQEHLRDAEAVLAAMAGRPVTFRSFDLGGGDKQPKHLPRHHEDNPALGLRSIRLALRESGMFRQQLRGLLRASVGGSMKIMFPMVSGVDELRQARALLEECREELAAAGHDVAEDLQVGLMIEMPSAAMVADLLAAECDFLSIGSNDLIQYALAIDRGNDLVNYLYRPLHPGILRLIRHVVRAGHDQGLPVSLCGAMAGDPLFSMVLVGLGLDELSMPASAIPQVKHVVRNCTAAESVSLVEALVREPTVEGVEAVVLEAMVPRFIDVL